MVDNAAVHHGYDSAAVLKDILTVFGVTIVYLPVYSPELNPCELVFNVVKRYIREHRDNYAKIPIETMEALASITRAHNIGFYDQ